MADSETSIPEPRAALLTRLGYRFSDPDQLDLALRHRSWCAENGGVESNERLEFLGDAVLGLVITDHLYRRAPEESEGVLARNRSEIVSSSALAVLAREIGLGDSLLLGKGEVATGGRDKTSILADALEAVIGAVFMDGGMEAAESVIIEVAGDLLETILEGDVTTDHKSKLQELTARDFGGLPDYRLEETGPEHDKRFSAIVAVDGVVRGSGQGHTKKAAEQAAALAALESLADEGELDSVTGDANPDGVPTGVEKDHA
ncbi:MAG: ribonuclease III [Microthrixaceae bacterium]|nr:ribonuclease III [Microthrixaceae bacterium]